MARSTKLGIASICLLGTMLLGGPIGFAGGWLSALLGMLAASNGSKWWLVIPASITVMVSLGLIVASYAY